jgi:catechol 2,3-dioxygenase-like lactoylglutathione lyase family enzyme
MIRGIHHVAIHTAHFDRLLAFYREAFGFEPSGEEFRWADSPFVDSIIGVEGSAARTVMLRAGNVYVEVFEYFSPPAGTGGPLRPHDRGYTHFAVDVTDIDADYERLSAAGMVFTRTVPDENGGVRSLYGKDPDGNIIEIQQLAPGHVSHFEHLPLVVRG